ncbi:transposase [Streptomyces sp. IBSBF 2807]|nr:transposase [Streptomyces hilarionis]
MPSGNGRPFLLVSNGRCGRSRDHRQVIDGILHRVRTAVQWRDLPERLGPWKTVYERHRLWSADGTWERLLQQVQVAADAAGESDWDLSVESTVARHVSTRSAPAWIRLWPPLQNGDTAAEHQHEMPWWGLAARLVGVAQEVRAWAAHAAGSPPSRTWARTAPAGRCL